MSEVQYLNEINNKMVRAKRLEFDELQSVSIYAHNDTDTKLKGLKINDDDKLLVSDAGTEITTVYSNDDLTVLGTSFTTLALPLKKNKAIKILIEAPDNANDINHITLEVEVGNFTTYYLLDSHYIVSHKSQQSIQAEAQCLSKNIKLKFLNNKGSAINLKVHAFQ